MTDKKNPAPVLGKDGKEVCRAFRNNGECRFGEDCKYEHSKGDPIAVPERDYKPKGDCHSWEKEKKCRFGDRCRFLHGSEDKRESYRPKRTENTSGEQEICRQYERRGRCRFGERCKHKHVEGAKKEKKEQPKGGEKKAAGGNAGNGAGAGKGQGAGSDGGAAGRRRRRPRGGAKGGSSENKEKPVTQYDKDGLEICRRFKDGGKCRFGEECTYSHGAPDPKATPKPGQEKKASGGDGGGRRRGPREPQECYDFQEKGNCEYGDECRFKHGANDKRDLKTARRAKAGPCYTFQEKGNCEYGDECRFQHIAE